MKYFMRLTLIAGFLISLMLVSCSGGGESNYNVRSAAEQGDAEAQNRLGLMYLGGDGVDQNYEEAAK